MDVDRIGIATLHTRVERWECDFNDHWNARYYVRSFQMAAERVEVLDDEANPGLALQGTRHIRFHREMFVGTAIEVRSARVARGKYAGAVVHLLSGDGRLAATALELPGKGARHLPSIDPAIVKPAFPRLAEEPTALEWLADTPDTRIAESGPVRPAEIDHTGAILVEEIVRRVAYALHHFLDRLGYTPDFLAETGISRMAVESAITPVATCPPGTLLRVRSRVVAVGRKSFTTKHRLETLSGSPIAVVQHSLVAVDLATRRAVEVPGFIREVGPSNEA